MQANKLSFKYLLVLFALFLMTSSCVEEYWPEINADSEQLLVVEGGINNFSGPYTVLLSISSSINEAIYTPLPLAKVTIIDNQGNQELLNESDAGIYKTASNGMQGIIGRFYKIRIQLNNGKIYESEFEELKSPVEVENISAKESIKLAVNTLETDQKGYQFYVSSKLAESEQTYLYWEIEETYEYHANYKIAFIYDGKYYPKTEDNPFGMAQPISPDTLYYCWKTQNVEELFSFSTEYLSNPIVHDFALHFVPFSNEKLRYKYSALVTQFTISKNAYTFFNAIKKQNENQGALFTSQPYQVRGNISNIENSSEAVLGYFLVAGGILAPRLLTQAPPSIRYDYPVCLTDTSQQKILIEIQNASQSNLQVYFTIVSFENPNPLGGPIEVLGFVPQVCIDCSRKGGVAIKPEYWDW